MMDIKNFKTSYTSRFFLLQSALFLSGVAGLMNQVVWQRALKIYLGGSEALSSMLVVLVFMLGLGVGGFLGGQIKKNQNPFSLFYKIEFSLFAINLIVSFLLAKDLSASIYSFQQAALAIGIPLRVLYSLTAFIILFIPCMLMGATLPVFSELIQRENTQVENRMIPVLFFINTSGAVLGALLSSFYILPLYGQKFSLQLSASLNLAAACMIWILGFSKKSLLGAPASIPTKKELSVIEYAAFCLGFLSMGYEMVLFRVMALAHEPLPYTFALTLCFFLAFWSLGNLLAAFLRQETALSISLAGASLFMIPVFYEYDRWLQHFSIVGRGLVYFLPCLFCGLAYGLLIQKQSNSWGRDIGRFYGLNTVGSCLGILFFTLSGFYLSPKLNCILIGFGFVLLLAIIFNSNEKKEKTSWAYFFGVPLASFALALVLNWSPPALKSYYHRDGVVEIDPQLNLSWDGLWHSSLSKNNNHIETNNWMLAALPLLSHDSTKIQDALVIGLGTGITAATLAQAPEVQSVDVYEINELLADILEDYPEGTLGVGSHPKVKIFWQDGRSGLALNPKKYDLITTQPLYLKQSGSSILLSEEYFKLAHQRLHPNGILCVYSNSQNHPDQALLVRNTLKNVFRYTESFQNGYILIASDQPITKDESGYRSNIARLGPLGLDILKVEENKSKLNSKSWSMLQLLDQPRMSWTAPEHFIITDNQPLVEYPDLVSKWLESRSNE